MNQRLRRKLALEKKDIEEEKVYGKENDPIPLKRGKKK